VSPAVANNTGDDPAKGTQTKAKKAENYNTKKAKTQKSKDLRGPNPKLDQNRTHE